MNMRHAIKSALVVGAVLAFFGGGKATGRAATSGLLATDVPESVVSGEAVRVGRHDAAAMLRLNVGLAVRDQAGLDEAWRAMTTLGSPRYGVYLTKEQYRERYAPTEASVRAARSWLEERGLTVTSVSPDNLLVHVHAPARIVEQAFGVEISDYRLGERTFYSNDRGPTVPESLGVHWISGLSNANVYTSAIKAERSNAAAFKPKTYRKAYDVKSDGSGLTIGFTVWGRALPQSDFDGYSDLTGTTPIVVGKSGDDGLEWIPIDGVYGNSDQDLEVAGDAEIAHGIAPGSHLKFFLGGSSSDSTMEDVLDQAANAGLDIVSNSWTCQVGLGCNPDRNMDQILQMGAMAGTSWFFGSGDSGAIGESYPTSSPYVVAVGGTLLVLDAGGNYLGEKLWGLAGAGCTYKEPPMPWQNGLDPNCIGGRAFPDVVANAGAKSDAYVNDDSAVITGTSVSTPLWAAFATTWNNNNIAKSRPKIGLLGPLLYSLGKSFHASKGFNDITSGNNGLTPGPGTGFDEASGWGSPDLDKLANNPVDIVYLGPTNGNDGQTISLSLSLREHFKAGDPGVFPLFDRDVHLSAANESCDAVTDPNGHANCFVTLHANKEPPGHYIASVGFDGDAAWSSSYAGEDFVVNGIPTKLKYTGWSSVPYGDSATLSATLTDDSSPPSLSAGKPIPGKTVEFTVGAESCSGVTDIDGVASCWVTLADPPGSSYGVVALFSGDSPAYLASGDAAHTLKVTKEDGALSYSGPAPTGDYHDPFVAKALFKDPDNGDPIVGRTIYFELGATDTCNGTTGSDGTASCVITPTLAPGSYTLKMSFNGDEFYKTASDNQTFTVTKEESSTVFAPPPPLTVAIGVDLKLSAHLTEDTSPPLAGRTLTFTIGSKPNTQSCTALTDASGKAGCTIANVQQPASGQYLFAKFAGDAFYEASQGKATITVVSPSRTLRRG